MKSLFTTYKQGHSFCHPWIYSTALSVQWLSLHVASTISLGGCDICNKLRALCVTYPMITFRFSHSKVVLRKSPVPSSVCRYLCYGMEIGDGSQDYAK